MAVLKLYEYPEEVLRQKCERVTKVDDELRKFLEKSGCFYH
jgi:peptide deformylase